MSNATHSPSVPSVDRPPNNAIRHGLTARQVVLPTESAEEWHAFERAYVEELQPAGIVEQTLAHRAAELQWRLLRVARVEVDAVNDRLEKPDGYTTAKLGAITKWHGANEPPEALPECLPAPSALRPLTRYEAHLARQYHNTMRELRTQQDRRLGLVTRTTRVEIHGYPGKRQVVPSTSGALAPPSATTEPGPPRDSATDPRARHSEQSEESRSDTCSLPRDSATEPARDPDTTKLRNELPSGAPDLDKLRAYLLRRFLEDGDDEEEDPRCEAWLTDPVAIAEDEALEDAIKGPRPRLGPDTWPVIPQQVASET